MNAQRYLFRQGQEIRGRAKATTKRMRVIVMRQILINIDDANETLKKLKTSGGTKATWI